MPAFLPDENCFEPVKKFIEDTINVNIRFSEVDSLEIVWHGNYLKFFEDGRENMGLKYGMSYKELYEKELILPLVDTQISFKSALKFGNTAKVVTRLFYNKAAKVIYQYEVYNLTTGKLAATGSTTQVFVDRNMELQLLMPEAYAQWQESVQWIEK